MLYNNRRTSLLSLIAALLLYITQARPLVRNIQSTHEFDRLLKKHATETGLPVVVDFYSDSCGPCRMMAPIFKQVAAQYADKAVFVKIDTNRQSELSGRYNVRSLPTFQYFLGGRKVDQAVGGIGEAALKQQTDKLIRQAEIENTVLTLERLTVYYKEMDAEKRPTDIQSVYDKCVGMTKGASDCVGAAANQLSRRLRKKYGKAPSMEPRFSSDASSKTNSSSSNSSAGTKPKPRHGKDSSSSSSGPNLHLATLDDLQAELERRLDEQRDQQVDREDPDEDEADPTNQSWPGPGLFPEKLVIVGGGPAGMAAAIYGARAGLSPLVIAPSLGGQLQGKGVDVENYPGLFNQTGPAVIAAMRAQAAHFGAVFEDDVVRAVHVEGRDPATEYGGRKPAPIQIVTNNTGTIETHSLIIATGAEANWLGVAGEWELRGGGVSSCAVCDGFLYAGKDVVVVGGGDAAMEDALVLARTSRKVTVVHRRNQFRASKVLADRVRDHPLITVVWNVKVQEILGKDIEPQQHSEEEMVDIDNVEKVVSGVILHDVITGESKQLACDAVFVAIGHTPSTSFLQGVVDFDPAHKGYILVGKGTTQTSVKGIYAAGDVSDAVYRQAITSAGSGAAAALDAERYLSEHGLGNEAAELEAELMADLMVDQQQQTMDSAAYNAYEDVGGRMEGMKESMATEL